MAFIDYYRQGEADTQAKNQAQDEQKRNELFRTAASQYIQSPTNELAGSMFAQNPAAGANVLAARGDIDKTRTDKENLARRTTAKTTLYKSLKIREAPRDQKLSLLKEIAPEYYAQIGADGFTDAEIDGIDPFIDQALPQLYVDSGVEMPTPKQATRNVDWLDVGDKRTPVYSDTGQDVPGLQPKTKGATPGGNAAADNRRFTQVDKLRDEYNAQSKDFVAIGDAFTRLNAAAQEPSAAGDLSLIFQYMKMLDPGSVVREQEFANAQNAAGVPERIVNVYNKALTGERLNPTQRADFIGQAKKLYTEQRARHEKNVKGPYRELAKRYQLNPDDVTRDLDVIAPQVNMQVPPTITNEAEYNALPTGTEYQAPDGSIRTKR